MNRVEIDPQSGFCPGVIRAIDSAQEYLKDHNTLYSLGAIVHNEMELERLSGLGLQTVTLEQLLAKDLPEGEKVLIRAHGEPPSTYEKLRQKGYSIIDCSCPVVLNIQKRIRNSQKHVLIFGKHGHPEVLGLVGQTQGAIVFENLQQLEQLLPTLDPSLEYELFSQTTMSPDAYAQVCAAIQSALPNITVNNTICAQVRTRHNDLRAFARNHSVVVFVAGKASSNGKVLSGICSQENPRTIIIGDPSELDASMFRDALSVGVCGATSTPRWLLDKVAHYIENLQ